MGFFGYALLGAICIAYALLFPALLLWRILTWPWRFWGQTHAPR